MLSPEKEIRDLPRIRRLAYDTRKYASYEKRNGFCMRKSMGRIGGRPYWRQILLEHDSWQCLFLVELVGARLSAWFVWFAKGCAGFTTHRGELSLQSSTWQLLVAAVVLNMQKARLLVLLCACLLLRALTAGPVVIVLINTCTTLKRLRRTRHVRAALPSVALPMFPSVVP